MADVKDTSGTEPVGIIELESNLSDAERPPELRNGKYRGEVQGVEVKTSGNSGNRYFAVKFVIPQDELPADLQEHYDDGAIMYWNRQLLPDKNDRRTLFNLRKFIEALGLSSATNSIDPNEWMGCQARLVVAQTAYNGEMRAQINAIEAIEDAPAPRRGRPPAETKKPVARGRR